MYDIKELAKDERIKKVFWFISKARKLGIFLLFGSCLLLVVTLSQYQQSYDSIINMIVLLIAIILGVINIKRPTKRIYFTSCLLYLLLFVLNTVVFIISTDSTLLFIIFVQLLVTVICLKTYLEIKNLEITINDRNKYKQILRSFNGYKSRDKVLKIKVYNTVESKIWKCIIVDDIILVTTRYKSELYISDKDNFNIIDSKENRVTKSVKGSLMMNGELHKFIMCSNTYQKLNTMLLS